MIRRKPAAPLRALLALAFLGALAACVADSPDRRHAPKRQPDNLIPATVQLWPGMPEDSNTNGYADTFDEVIMYVWPLPQQSAQPMWLDAALSVRLVHPETGERVAEWDFTPEQLERQRVRTNVGPAYGFRLSVLDVAPGDRFGLNEADLVAVLTLQGDDRPVSSAPTSVILRGVH